MRFVALALALTAVPALALAADCPSPAYPEAKPFGSVESGRASVDTALMAAIAADKRVILVFGANWCHDSRALAGWFATPRFQTMLHDRYEIAWINVGDKPGEKDRNGDLARRFGLGPITGTPTVLVLDSTGKPVNLADAPTWRNAASRSGDAIFAYFAKR
ncbi:thioredoxin family protein [Sphingomonas panacisoli]|uniref:Thioredoxin family protein n=1 Tax=Sphingomonas panacisoli TaxID=1813879 RepID=A0A5B8LJM8_9SPHN|nr:thioredoxin family protein [Sphingomonas panacisoli]QDZ08393.1 thioredoxin family protein [Sphingomonas panacisoli]